MDTLLANRYALETEIAAGAAGTVWRARDTQTGQTVAVKVLRHDAATDADVVKAFRDEADVLSEVDHPGVVRPRDFIATDEQLALVMDLVEGTDLRHRVRSEGPLPPGDAVRMVADVADALGAVHAAGIVHGDVKPGNILVPHDGGPARLADFGVARRVQSGESATHGTPEYLAPEVVAGNRPTLPADVYALGIVLYELVSGRSPFRGGPVHEVLRRQQDCVALQPPGMPDQLWQVITQCLERDPRTRPSAAELAVSLRSLRPAFNGMLAAAPVPESVPTYRPRQLTVEPVSAAPVSPAPVPVSATPVSVFPGVPGPVSPGMPGLVPPPPGAPAGSFPPAAHHAPNSGLVPPNAPVTPAAPAALNPWEVPPDSKQPDFLTAVLAAPAATAAPTPAPAAGKRRGRLLAGIVGAVAAVVLAGFVATLLIMGGGAEPTDAKHPPAASDERDKTQSPAPSPSPSREPSPSPEPEDSTPPSPSQQSPQPGDGGEDDGGDDDGPGPSRPAPPTNEMPTLPPKPSFTFPR